MRRNLTARVVRRLPVSDNNLNHLFTGCHVMLCQRIAILWIYISIGVYVLDFNISNISWILQGQSFHVEVQGGDCVCRSIKFMNTFGLLFQLIWKMTVSTGPWPFSNLVVHVFTISPGTCVKTASGDTMVSTAPREEYKKEETFSLCLELSRDVL